MNLFNIKDLKAISELPFNYFKPMKGEIVYTATQEFETGIEATMKFVMRDGVSIIIESSQRHVDLVKSIRIVEDAKIAVLKAISQVLYVDDNQGGYLIKKNDHKEIIATYSFSPSFLPKIANWTDAQDILKKYRKELNLIFGINE